MKKDFNWLIIVLVCMTMTVFATKKTIKPVEVEVEVEKEVLVDFFDLRKTFYLFLMIWWSGALFLDKIREVIFERRCKK